MQPSELRSDVPSANSLRVVGLRMPANLELADTLVALIDSCALVHPKLSSILRSGHGGSAFDWMVTKGCCDSSGRRVPPANGRFAHTDLDFGHGTTLIHREDQTRHHNYAANDE